MSGTDAEPDDTGSERGDSPTIPDGPTGVGLGATEGEGTSFEPEEDPEALPDE